MPHLQHPGLAASWRRIDCRTLEFKRCDIPWKPARSVVLDFRSRNVAIG